MQMAPDTVDVQKLTEELSKVTVTVMVIKTFYRFLEQRVYMTYIFGNWLPTITWELYTSLLAKKKILCSLQFE